MAARWALVKQVEGENPWVTYANKMVYIKNNAINLACTGQTGSGKSWALLSYFCMIDPDFDVNENCFFKALDLVRFFQKNIDNLKGKTIMFDEAGVDASSLKWQSDINKGLNAFFSTARHRNYIFGLTVPYLNFISKGVRTLMNTHFEANGWTSDNLTKIKPRIMQYNGEYDKFYKKRLIVKNMNGEVTRCNEIRLHKPPPKIVHEYERIKKEFTKDLFGEIADNIEEARGKKKGEAQLNLTAKQERCLELLKTGKNGVQIAREMGEIPVMIYQIIKSLRKKGIKVQKVTENGTTGGYNVEDGVNEPVLYTPNST